jgi:hypothetical protein
MLSAVKRLLELKCPQCGANNGCERIYCKVCGCFFGNGDSF